MSEDSKRLLEVLDALCQDSLETSLGTIVTADLDGEIDVLFKEAHDIGLALVQELEETQRKAEHAETLRRTEFENWSVERDRRKRAEQQVKKLREAIEHSLECGEDEIRGRPWGWLKEALSPGEPPWPINPEPIPPEDVERARGYVRERGWVEPPK